MDDKCTMRCQELKRLSDKVRKLTDENKFLQSKNTELSHMLNEVYSIKNVFKKEPRFCGQVVIEGSRTSAAYQDMVGILLYSNYTVKLEPLEERKKVKITIYESEE